jgi:IS30 family transposase
MRIGLLREFYPKKTDLSEVNEKELRLDLYLINNRPRKCLSWKSAFEVFFNELVQLI